MAGGREIKSKIKSVQNTRKVTRALEMVSASKIRKAQERMKSSRPYARLMKQMIAHISQANAEYKHPFMLAHKQVKRVGYVVISTDRGLAAILATSDPSEGFVAPFGGKEALLTPNPIAIAYPGTRLPVWIDVSTSITTVGMTRQKSAANTPFEHRWLIDADGGPTNDPHVLDPGAGGSLLLLGGREYGHKGFGLSLMIEMLTQGLAGFGRQDSEKRWGGNVFLQVIDPGAFAGREAFLRQMDYLTDRCHANAPIDPSNPVRMPGEMAQQRIREAEQYGVTLAPPIVEALTAAAVRLGVSVPAAIAR